MKTKFMPFLLATSLLFAGNAFGGPNYVSGKITSLQASATTRPSTSQEIFLRTTATAALMDGYILKARQKKEIGYMPAH